MPEHTGEGEIGGDMPRGRKKKVEAPKPKKGKYTLFSLTEEMLKLNGDDVKSRAVANIAKGVANPNEDIMQVQAWKETFFIVRK